MKKIVIAIGVFFAFAANQAFAAQTIKATVHGMVCAFCAQGIEKKFHSMAETKDVYVNLKKKIVAIEVKDGQAISDDTVKSTIKDAGYEVVSIETVQSPVATIKSELEAK